VNDPVLRMLRRLPALTPDESRAARVRARCHATLAREQARLEVPPVGVPRLLEHALAGLSVAYLGAVAREMWRMFKY